MARGYAGKYLEVDLTNEKIRNMTFDEEVLKQFIGGRALACKILWDRLGSRWETIDPLGPENIFLALTGPMTGFYPGPKTVVSGKSPESNGIVGSAVSGEFEIELKCAGYDGVIVTGRAKKPVYIFVKDGNAEIRDAQHLWGKDAKQTIRLINKEIVGELESKRPRDRLWKEPGILYIGPAGENRVRAAAVEQKWTHGAGYGGYGAVMGSKNLKAIVAKGTGPLPEPYDYGKVKDLIQKIVHYRLGEDSMRRWGTGAAGYTVGADTSSEPIRNWQEEWHDRKEFGVDQFERKVWRKRYWGDFGCPSTCLKLASVLRGPYKGAISDNPDYEMQAYEGPNLGIFDPEANVYMSSVSNDLGFCGIQGGNLLAFTAELYERGILTKEDLGFELKWGDARAFERLAWKIVKREGIGDILAEGTYRAAIKIGRMKGVDCLKYAVHVKGIAIGAHGIRSALDYPPPIAYACNVQGGDHTSVSGMGPEEEPGELAWGFMDSATICAFNSVRPLETVWEFYRAVTGWETTMDEWNTIMGPRMLSIQRAALLIGGPDVRWDPRVDDDNPPRFYEPLPSGPKAGQAASRKEVQARKKKWFNSLGWDDLGIPTSETLKKLGLESVDKALEPIRELYKG
jgi:aldehyde:ferredoxin oxidoreductase